RPLPPRHLPPRHPHAFPTRRSSDLVALKSPPLRAPANFTAAVKIVADSKTVAETTTETAPRTRVIGAEKITAANPTGRLPRAIPDRKSTRLNSSHVKISYAVFCLKK